MYIRSFVLAILFVSFLSLLSPVQAAVFEFDPTFGVSGIAVSAEVVGDSSAYGMSFTREVSGKYLLSGATGNGDEAVWRLNEDGSIDTTFGNAGVRTFDLGVYGGFRSIVATSDGKYISCGNTDTDILVARLLQNSDFDTGFAGSGYVYLDGGGGQIGEYCSEILEDDSGKYVGVAGIVDGSLESHAALFRYNTDGTLDTGFDGDGMAVLPTLAGSTYSIGSGLALQADGKYLMIGSTGNSDGGVDIVVARYNSDGSLDDTFDSDGYATTNPDSLGLSANDANAITVLPDGKFLVAGWTAFADDGGLDVSLWKFSSNGSLDTSFGISGYISFDVNLGASDESE